MYSWIDKYRSFQRASDESIKPTFLDCALAQSLEGIRLLTLSTQKRNWGAFILILFYHCQMSKRCSDLHRMTPERTWLRSIISILQMCKLRFLAKRYLALIPTASVGKIKVRIPGKWYSTLSLYSNHLASFLSVACAIVMFELTP